MGRIIVIIIFTIVTLLCVAGKWSVDWAEISKVQYDDVARMCDNKEIRDYITYIALQNGKIEMVEYKYALCMKAEAERKKTRVQWRAIAV